MAKDRTLLIRNGKEEEEEETEEENEHSLPHGIKKSKRKKEIESEEESDSSEDIEDTKHSRSKKKHRKRSSKPRRKSRRKYSDSSDSSSSYSHSSDSEESDSESESSDYSSSDESDSEEERRRRKRRERKRRRRKESEYEKEKRRKRRKKEKMKDKKRKSGKDVKEKKKKKEKSKGAVTNSWGKYGIIRETDMWNKRPEFNAWLAEVKKVNLESLPNWEEKNMFKEFMEDHNTATFPSKKYYDLDAYQRRKVEKQIKKGSKILESERTIFNDEEQRRQELMLAREKQKEQEVENLKRSMQSGMAQAMKEQSRLREEMAYQYKLGNFEAAAAIQRRLDPDVAM